MKSAIPSILTAGVVLTSATSIAITPTVQPLPTRQLPVHLAASSSVLQQASDPLPVLTEWARIILLAPGIGTPPPSPPEPQPAPTPGSVSSNLEALYHAVEPWVEYGFDLAEYALSWVPYVGWLSGQVSILYNFGERITHAIVHNTLDFFDGDGTFIQNVAQATNEVINAFIQLGIDEWNYFLPPLPPLPPLPCFFCGTQAATTLSDEEGSTAVERPMPKLQEILQDVTSRVTPGADDLVDRVDSTPTQHLADLPRNKAIKAAVTAPRTVADGVVRAQGQLRGGVKTAVEDVSQAAGGGQRGAVRQALSDAPSTVAKGVTNGVKTAVGGVQKAREDVRTAVKAARSDSES